MIDTQITPFMKISMKHLFYENEKMQDLQIVPSPETGSLMQKMGIFTKIDSSSLLLAFSERTATHFEDNPSKVVLAFNLKNTNPYFQSITNLDVFPPNQKAFYFDNLDKIENDENVILLHHSEFASSDNLLPWLFARFEFLPKSGIKEMAIADNLNNVVETFTMKDYLIEGTEDQYKSILVDLGSEVPGVFKIVEDGVETQSIYCTSEERNPVFGMLYLYLDQEMIKPPAEGKRYTWEYEIKFENRKTQWRYYFLNSQFQEFPDFNISHPKENIEFHPPVLKNLQNGSSAWELTSKTRIPLKQRYQDFFTITFKLNQESNQEVTINLPNADAQKIRRVIEGEKEVMYSDAYVYI